MKRLNCTVGDKRGINGDCMELATNGDYVTYADSSKCIAELEKENEWLFDFALEYTNRTFINESLQALKESK